MPLVVNICACAIQNKIREIRSFVYDMKDLMAYSHYMGRGSDWQREWDSHNRKQLVLDSSAYACLEHFYRVLYFSFDSRYLSRAV